MSLLTLNALTKNFGGLIAVNEVSFSVNKGEIYGLIGPNGSGKTTIFNLISGVYKPTKGDIVFDDKNIQGLRPDKITELGIARTFQNIRLFKDLSVFNNVLIGCHCKINSTFIHDLVGTKTKTYEDKLATERAEELLDFFGLLELKDEKAKNLPYGMQRELEIVRALAVQPKLILLDEPAAGMNPQESNNLMELIFKIRDRGITILIVDHDMKVVMGICDRIVVLNYGSKIAEDIPERIQRNENVIQAYLGRRDAEYA